MKNIPSLARINDLISGEEVPESTGEWVMLEIYAKALTGDAMINIIIDEKESLNKMDKTELSMLILGYALGQRDFIEATDEIRQSNAITNTGDDTVH